MAGPHSSSDAAPDPSVDAGSTAFQRRELSDRFRRALAEHDDAIHNAGLAIWVGGEPTFTDRHSGDAQWVSEALGAEKLQRSAQIAADLADRHAGSLILRTVGRQYPEEELPRWSLGVYRWRNGRPLWNGPPDPCLLERRLRLAHDDRVPANAPRPDDQVPATSPAPEDQRPSDLRAALRNALGNRGWKSTFFDTEGPWAKRMLCHRDSAPAVDTHQSPELLRGPLDLRPIAPDGCRDTLAEQGLWLLCLGMCPDTGAVCVQLPEASTVETFVELIDAVGEASNATGLSTLVLKGFGPPVDARISWTTVTPDPGVAEINMAPCTGVVNLYDALGELYEAAHQGDLSPQRLHFNGEVADSGGGGHLTLGGPSPSESPFLQHPELLPRVVAFFLQHPSLSYLFAEHVGSSSQAPRADEGSRESFEELRLALSLLERKRPTHPETLWRTLAPFLTDRFGNTHRAELNIEKLWNPFLPGRGTLGLVEFRALRMPPSTERWAALAVLFRSILAHLLDRDQAPEWTDWGTDLHDRFMLPFFLQKDFDHIGKTLQESGFPLHPQVHAELSDVSHRFIAKKALPGATLELRRGFECWPLIGDLNAQGETSRRVDPSCKRLEVLLRPDTAAHDWRLAVGHSRHRFHAEEDAQGMVLLRGIRYRAFLPSDGLHPLVAAQDPFEFQLEHPEFGAHSVRIFSWNPDGKAYSGLPDSVPEAKRRTEERVVLTRTKPRGEPRSKPAAESEEQELSGVPYCLDARGLTP